MQKEVYFLTYNKDNIFKSFLQAEDHLRQLQNSPEYKPGFQNCIIKHLAFAEAEADEAVSHSLVTIGKEQSHQYASLRDNISLLRKKLMSNEINNDDAILGIRESRAMFEKINPDYDISKCQACGDMESVEKLSTSLNAIDNVENNMVSDIIRFLSEKYNVPAPKIEIVQECHDPEKGLYTDKTIRLCSGGASVHVATHEFAHYIQDLNGKNLDEAEAERFALDFIEKGLKPKTANYNSSEHKMNQKLKDVAIIYGSVNLGYGVIQGAQMASATYPTFHIPLIVESALTALGVYALLKLKGVPAEILGYMGAIASTDLIWRQIPALTVGLGSTGLRMNNRVSNPVNYGFKQVPTTSMTPATVTNSTAQIGKYVVK